MLLLNFLIKAVNLAVELSQTRGKWSGVEGGEREWEAEVDKTTSKQHPPPPETLIYLHLAAFVIPEVTRFAKIWGIKISLRLRLALVCLSFL